MSFATISVDLDPTDVHLAGYGHAAPLDRRVYELALPRLLEVFARHRVRATFFVLGRDAFAARDAFRAIAGAGHEVASHSMDHPPRLASLRGDALQHQLVESRRVLGEVIGDEIEGFRAPDWSIGREVVLALSDAGYRYDASLMPSPALTAGRAVLALRSRRAADVMGLRPPASMRRRPFTWREGSAGVMEFPVTVTRGLRLPVYHTLRYAMGDERFAATLDALAQRGEPLSYPLHGIDAMGLEEDGLDPRLARHPGVSRPLAEKLRLLDVTVREIAQRFEVRPFRDRVGDDPAR